jgi:hypothetical protein
MDKLLTPNKQDTAIQLCSVCYRRAHVPTGREIRHSPPEIPATTYAKQTSHHILVQQKLLCTRTPSNSNYIAEKMCNKKNVIFVFVFVLFCGSFEHANNLRTPKFRPTTQHFSPVFGREKNWTRYPKAT